jgi:hypothetical protein
MSPKQLNAVNFINCHDEKLLLQFSRYSAEGTLELCRLRRHGVEVPNGSELGEDSV